MTSYSPVSAFHLDVLADAYVGFAAPPPRSDGPGLVVLTADETPIAYSRAGRFSPLAEAAGHRRGWCGFFLPGRALAMGLGDKVELRCGVTNKVLAQPGFEAPLLGVPAPSSHQISVIELVALSRQGESCLDLEQLEGFARHHLHKHGIHSFLNATYQMFFGRDADRQVLDSWLIAKDPDGEISLFLKGLTSSSEFSAKSFPHLPGPFQTHFRYDRDFIG